MTNDEVIKAADHIETAIKLLLYIEKEVGFNYTVYAPVFELPVLGSKNTDQSHTLFNYNTNTASYNNGYIYHSINVGLFTWLQINHTGKAKHTTNTILFTPSDDSSILLSTNAGSDKVSKIKRTELNDVFEIQKVGTPESDEYLFFKSLEQDDFTMNALIFQYEWRRRYGMNIVLRLGRDPVLTCSSIEKIARHTYEEFVKSSSNTSFD